MKVITGSQEETEELGFKFGVFIKTQSIGAALLYGDLGAGKTTFIKGMASAFGIPPRDIGSASFVIVAEYDTTPRFYHIDLYRIEKSNEIEELGIWEYMDSGGFAVVEWAERLPEVPDNAVKVRINYCGADCREIVIEGVPEAPGGVRDCIIPEN